MTIDVRKAWIAAVGGCAALMFAAPAAAEPEMPPVPVPPAADAVAQAPAEGVPHLPSPEALPPGATMDPTVMAGAESPNVSYLRDLWQAVQSREISGKEALLLGISQRNLNTPIPAQAPGPNVPIAPGAPAPVAPPVPAPVPPPMPIPAPPPAP